MANEIIRMDQGWRLDQNHHFDQPPNVPSPAPVVSVVAKQRKGVKTMDFIPRKRAERYLWWKNLSANLPVEGPKMGLSAAQVTAAIAVADDMIAKMDARDAADAAAAGAMATENTVAVANETSMRALVRNWKTLPGYPASGSEGVLNLRTIGTAFDPSTYKPVIKASVEGGVIRIDFTKAGVDAVNIYCRLRGTQGWRKLALDSASPYFDTMPLANAAVPETREYMARGVMDDVEIGLDSDIVSVVFGG